MKHLVINESDLLGLYSGVEENEFSLEDPELCTMHMKSEKIDASLLYMEGLVCAHRPMRIEMSSAPLSGYIHLGYVIDGSPINYIDGWGTAKEMEAGQFCLVYTPNMDGYCDYRAQQSVASSSLCMDVSLLHQLLQHEPRPQVTHLFQPIFDTPQICFSLFGSMSQSMLKQINQLYRQPSLGVMNGLSRRASAYALLQLSLDRIVEEHCRDLGPVKLIISDVPRLEQVKEMLNSQLQSPPTLSQIAKTVGLNEFKLKQGFKQLNQKTVFEYLLELRMRKSSYLLETSQMPIIDIALQVGYNNHGHFSSAFRNFFGKTPSMHRRSYATGVSKMAG